MPDPLFDSMITDTESVKWASTAHLRDRARQRTRRTRIATVVPVFAAVAGVVGGVALAGTNRGAPSPMPGGSTGRPSASATRLPSTEASSPPSSAGSSGTARP